MIIDQLNFLVEKQMLQELFVCLNEMIINEINSFLVLIKIGIVFKEVNSMYLLR